MKKAARWIIIGDVKPDWFVIALGWGVPHGLYLHWRGRVSWCQPAEFFAWKDLIAAVRHRLRLARLELIAVACAVLRRADYIRLHVQVQRIS